MKLLFLFIIMASLSSFAVMGLTTDYVSVFSEDFSTQGVGGDFGGNWSGTAFQESGCSGEAVVGEDNGTFTGTECGKYVNATEIVWNNVTEIQFDLLASDSGNGTKTFVIVVENTTNPPDSFNIQFLFASGSYTIFNNTDLVSNSGTLQGCLDSNPHNYQINFTVTNLTTEYELYCDGGKELGWAYPHNISGLQFQRKISSNADFWLDNVFVGVLDLGFAPAGDPDEGKLPLEDAANTVAMAGLLLLMVALFLGAKASLLRK